MLQRFGEQISGNHIRSAECVKASSSHWRSVRLWFRLPRVTEEQRRPLESHSITPKWTDCVEMRHDNKGHQRISPAAGPLQRSSLPQEGCNKGERSRGKSTVSPSEVHLAYGCVFHHFSIKPLRFHLLKDVSIIICHSLAACAAWL